MNVVVLTTETPHHAHFVRELARDVRVPLVVSEHRRAPRPAPPPHPTDVAREKLEIARWFGGRRPRLAEIAPTLDVERADGPEAVARVARAEPDAVIVFGTGKLSGPLLERHGERLVNLHGGDPETYRGLDTHLWAIYRSEFAELVTTLHVCTAELDGGDVVEAARVPVAPGMPLAALRAHVTELCVALCRRALAGLAAHGAFPTRAQRRRGRYYPAMPAALKDVCRARFESYARRIP